MSDRESPVRRPVEDAVARAGLLAGFEERRIEVDGATIRVRTAGTGAPLLLLHGYPQTGAMWHAVGSALATGVAGERCVVVPDLRGYGASLTHDGDHTFAAMAADQVAVMGELGHPTFDVVGHDRGARTAHRLALDHPGVVRSLALLDILPTLEVWERFDAWLAQRYFHWTFLAQPGGLPERVLAAAPLDWLDHALSSLGGTGGMHPDAVTEYEVAALRRSVTDAWCADYRAAATEDVVADRADVGRTLDVETLVLWGERGVVGAQVDPVAAWRAWFPAAYGHAVPTGHFVAEERPDLVVAALAAHLGRETTLGPAGTLGPCGPPEADPASEPSPP